MTFNLEQRVSYFTDLFEVLESTDSRNEKLELIEQIPEILKDDFIYLLKCLTGEVKFGYTYPWNLKSDKKCDFETISDVLNMLLLPIQNGNLTSSYITDIVSYTLEYEDFFRMVVNRLWKIGIGKSLLEKPKYSPMLAKKYEGVLKPDSFGYVVTEKLDGNRCLAYFDYIENKWKFMSRNGKEMYVQFDMGNLPKDVIYDGEILSKEQVELSNKIFAYVVNNIVSDEKTSISFNKTSGEINKHGLNKDLIYNIFDVIYIDESGKCRPTEYIYRRSFLGALKLPENSNIRILPILKHTFDDDCFYDILDKVTSLGGEGIMINYAGKPYEQKRSDYLLKFKKVQTMDMKVIDFEYGTGKYAGCVGALICEVKTEDGKYIYCRVGTGLSDEQRISWAMDTDEIIGKIVEIGYFSLSQNKNDLGSNRYSLRFPRLLKIRYDKNETSEY